MSDHKDDDDEPDGRNHDRNENCDTTAGQCIQIQLGQIHLGTAVSELNLFQFCLLLIENFNSRIWTGCLSVCTSVGSRCRGFLVGIGNSRSCTFTWFGVFLRMLFVGNRPIVGEGMDVSVLIPGDFLCVKN